MPASRSDSVRPRRVSLIGMLLVAATGSLCVLPAPSSAGPATLPNCLRSPKVLTSAGSASTLVPPSVRPEQLMAQALPAGSAATAPSARASETTAAATGASGPALVAQAPASAPSPSPAPTINGTQLLPACTYDPPLASPPKIIRGLW